ncbi:MAG: TonB-dependent receptor, partial [Motiliproteus sp.]|nr:TonB-dependent receptor [Motiliproteus sp.]
MKIDYRLWFSALLLSPYGAASTDAAEVSQVFSELYSEEELVSVATGTEIPLNKAPAVASVITRQQIDAMGATNLSEVMERVPGLHAMPSSVRRLAPVFSIRGIQTGFNPQVLVLLNGTKFKNSYNSGLPSAFRMPLSNVKRIEVIRGPGSAIYGADAFSGVVNIITNTADDNLDGEAGVRYGSFNSRDFWLRNGFRSNQLSLSFALEHQQSNGDDSRIINADRQTSLDTALGSNASLAPGAISSRYETTNLQIDLGYENWLLENWYWRQSDAGVGVGAANAIDNRGYQDGELWRVRLGYDNQINSSWSLASNLSYMQGREDVFLVLFPAGSTLPVGTDGNAFSTPFSGFVTFTDGYIGNPRGEGSIIEAELSTVYSGLNNHLVRMAGGWTQEEFDTEELKNFGPGVIDGTVPVIDGTLTDVTGTPNIFLEDQRRTHYFISLQDEWQFSNSWSLTSGVRWDHYSDFGSSINPRIALVWDTNQRLTTKLLYGTAFRAPAFSEQYLINNPAALGNPDLEPEEIETLELTFDYRPDFDTSIKLSLFAYEANDLIDTVTMGSVQQAQNARKQEGYGIELELFWQASHQFKVYGNYAFQHAEDADTGEDVADAPQHSTYLDLNYRLNEQLSASLQHYWIGSRPRASGDSRDEIDDYHWFNSRVDYQLKGGQLKLSLIVKNLLDSHAEEPAG